MWEIDLLLGDVPATVVGGRAVLLPLAGAWVRGRWMWAALGAAQACIHARRLPHKNLTFHPPTRQLGPIKSVDGMNEWALIPSRITRD